MCSRAADESKTRDQSVMLCSVRGTKRTCQLPDVRMTETGGDAENASDSAAIVRKAGAHADGEM
jgi:hypothetical protein